MDVMQADDDRARIGDMFIRAQSLRPSLSDTDSIAHIIVSVSHNKLAVFDMISKELFWICGPGYDVWFSVKHWKHCGYELVRADVT